jgi:transcriptional regulator with GAF, ATPase, and Fis domain
MVACNEFRSDLYYRLNVFPVLSPPLRERREDIRQLVQHFVDLFARRMGKPIEQIPPTTMDAFIAYPWPGNVRELQNLIERAVILQVFQFRTEPPACESAGSKGRGLRVLVQEDRFKAMLHREHFSACAASGQSA